MNSTVQCLAALPELATCFSGKAGQGPIGLVSGAFRNLLQQMQRPNASTVTPIA